MFNRISFILFLFASLCSAEVISCRWSFFDQKEMKKMLVTSRYEIHGEYLGFSVRKAGAQEVGEGKKFGGEGELTEVLSTQGLRQGEIRVFKLHGDSQHRVIIYIEENNGFIHAGKHLSSNDIFDTIELWRDVSERLNHSINADEFRRCQVLNQ